MNRPNKVLIIGSPGAGKSTIAPILSKKYNLPLLQLDRIYHDDKLWSKNPQQKKKE